MAMSHPRLPLFGGPRAWDPTEWTSSDDRVRGGSSTSTLTCSASSLTALFHGNLDTKTLGGAGFASQRTTTESKIWDLSHYDGLQIVLDEKHMDGKMYTITLKEEILPKRPDGREQSTVSWENDFYAKDAEDGVLFLRFVDFRPTYRGKDKSPDEYVLDLTKIRRFGIMCRSFFDEQDGPFELGIISIAAKCNERTLAPPDEMPVFNQDFDEKWLPTGEGNWDATAEKCPRWKKQKSSGWFSWLISCLGCRS
ncbi:hypothetical protein N7520_003694 [Penicillium odoratum]|uniref:uncharacterized protein n=1 Tax=Penicillium odoratum TaxID=1167516 RepID=UPI0025488A64|nr:uncharacterized protein N7520_003694 [Penicillium odoratum]KAJ5769135.1 hypothetical protein N7520_003694 [Penicillium odoratum]